MINILYLLVGFALGSIYSWFIMRHYGNKIVIADIKQDIDTFIDVKKQQILTAITVLKDELFEVKNPNKEYRENEIVYTPYGSY